VIIVVTQNTRIEPVATDEEYYPGNHSKPTFNPKALAYAFGFVAASQPSLCQIFAPSATPFSQHWFALFQSASTPFLYFQYLFFLFYLKMVGLSVYLSVWMIERISFNSTEKKFGIYPS